MLNRRAGNVPLRPGSHRERAGSAEALCALKRIIGVVGSDCGTRRGGESLAQDRWAVRVGFVVLVVLLGVVAVALGAPPVAAARPCPSNLAKSTTLAANCSGAITIVKSGITLDCAGFLVAGAGSGNGITLGPGIHGVTVRNCVLTNFAIGFYLNGAFGNTLQGNVALGPGQNVSAFTSGFYLDGANGNNLQGNVAAGENTSFVFVSSNANNVTENTANTDLTSGFYLQASQSNVLADNTAVGSGVLGFLLSVDSANNTLLGNAAMGRRGGFTVFASPGNALTDNRATLGDTGFDVDFTSFNVLTGNTADNNTGDGFLLSDSAVQNTLIGNAADDNGGYGYHDFDAGTGTGGTTNTYVANECSGNVVGGSAPFGLCSPQGTPVGAVQDLISKVDVLESGGVLTPRQAGTLLSPLNKAVLDLEANRTKGAIRDLQNFEALVTQDVTAGVLTPTQAQPLLDEACVVLQFLGGTC